ELLTRASMAQNPIAQVSIRSSQRPLTIRQKVQIRNGTQIIVRDFEWPAGKATPLFRWNSRQGAEEGRSPLTAEGFADWRNSLAGKKDSVEQSGEMLTLETIAEGGPIQTASVVVRANDYHPLEQHIRFDDGRQLDFRELAFDVVFEPEVPKGITEV